MNDPLDRMMKKLQGDGPAERQILLMKLIHEFENAPEFGKRYVAYSASEPQRGMALIGALLTRSGMREGASFRATKQISVSYWSLARESFRQQLLAAAEEIKLELELDGHEEIGQVYEPQRQYDFLRDLKEIILGVQSEVFVDDTYFDGGADTDTYSDTDCYPQSDTDANPDPDAGTAGGPGLRRVLRVPGRLGPADW